jgi:nucleoside-diphosphate-sugar epimerase
MADAVLVTGGAGFIGSHLTEALLSRGYRVRVMDSLIYGKREWVPPEAEFIKADICDPSACREAVAGMQGVFHAAAMSRSGPSLDNIDGCTEANIVGTQNVLVAARDARVRKVVYSGSSTYYGSRPTPHHEYETPSHFLNFYGLSKRVGEQYCLLFDDLYGLPAVVLRYFNVYGPRQPQVGAYALVLGIFLKRWAEDESLIIHGDGAQRRDFVHVRDVVRANIMAYESDRHGTIYNVGSGENVSIKELADLISPNQTHEARRKGDAEVTLAAIDRIRADLRWKPEVSFEEGLRELKQRVKSGLE